MMKKLFLCFIFLNVTRLFSQEKVLDSLDVALQKAKHDTTRCKVLVDMMNADSEDENLPGYAKELKKICDNNLSKIGRGDATYPVFRKYLAHYLTINGYLAQMAHDDKKAIDYYTACERIYNETQGPGNTEIDPKGKSSVINNLGMIFKSQGNLPKAMDYFLQGLKREEAIGNKSGLSITLLNLGSLCNIQGDRKKALEYYQKSLGVLKSMGAAEEKKSTASCLNNMAIIYHAEGDTAKSLEYYKKSYEIYEQIHNRMGMASAMNNMASIYDKRGDWETAMDYMNASLAIREEIHDKKGIAGSLNSIGALYYGQKKYDKALDYFKRSMALGRELGYPENMKSVALNLSNLYKKKNDYKLALENYVIYTQMKDSLSSEAARKLNIKNQLRYEYEKQAAADSVAYAKEAEIKNAELAKQEVEIRAKRNQQYALYGGLALVMIFAGVMYNRFRITQKQKQIISHQKDIVEEKQREILDSIQYARRIQRALITNEKYIGRKLDELNKVN